MIPLSGRRNVRLEHSICRPAETAPDLFYPVKMLRLHEHRAQASDRAACSVLFRPAWEEAGGQVCKREVQIFLRGGVEDFLRQLRGLRTVRSPYRPD